MMYFWFLFFIRITQESKVSDPVWNWLDPITTCQDKPDPDPEKFGNRIQIRIQVKTPNPTGSGSEILHKTELDHLSMPSCHDHLLTQSAIGTWKTLWPGLTAPRSSSTFSSTKTSGMTTMSTASTSTAGTTTTTTARDDNSANLCPLPELREMRCFQTDNLLTTSHHTFRFFLPNFFFREEEISHCKNVWFRRNSSAWNWTHHQG